MKIGITICGIALVNLIYLYFGGIINENYITGSFIGGVMIAFIEDFIFHAIGETKEGGNK